MVKLTKASDSVVKRGNTLDINKHVILIPKDAIEDTPTKLPKSFSNLDFKSFSYVISIAKTFDADVISFSKSDIFDRIKVHGHCSDPTTNAWFTVMFRGILPAEITQKIILKTEYLRRFLKLPKNETNEFGWGFAQHLSLIGVVVPTFRFKTFYWYQMPCVGLE